MKALSLMACLVSLGCHSVILVNVAGITRQASTVGLPSPPEVQCAALAGATLALTAKPANGSLDAVKVCEDAVATQRDIDKKKVKP